MASRNEIFDRVVNGYEIDKSIRKKFYNIDYKQLRNMAVIFDHATGDTYKEIAERYKITERAVRYIITGK